MRYFAWEKDYHVDTNRNGVCRLTVCNVLAPPRRHYIPPLTITHYHHTVKINTPRPPHYRVHGFDKSFFPTIRQLVDLILCRNARVGDMTVFDMFVGTLTKSITEIISVIRFTSGEPLEGDLRVPRWKGQMNKNSNNNNILF